jgi:heme/copper-type cytochrome/quinol oxidase subunit 2
MSKPVIRSFKPIGKPTKAETEDHNETLMIIVVLATSVAISVIFLAMLVWCVVRLVNYFI